MLIDILDSKLHLEKFQLSLPASRICLLLLGPRPNSTVAAQVLNLVATLTRAYPHTPRKLELTHFWISLKSVLPSAWDPSVHVATFDLFLGRGWNNLGSQPTSTPGIACPHIFPAILACLEHGLDVLVNSAASEENGREDALGLLNRR